MQLTLTPPARFGLELDFIRSSDVLEGTATLVGAGSSYAQIAGAGGAARLTTDAADNDTVSVQLDNAPMVITQGQTTLAAIFGAPSDVDNADCAIGWVTTDTDWLGDAATATEYVYVGFIDAGSSDSETPLSLFYKNASGSGSVVLTDLVVKEGEVYYLQLQITLDAEGNAAAVVVLTEVEANGGVPSSVVEADIARKPIPYLPAGLVNLSYALQNGSAAAKTWDIDWVKFEGNRYVG
jgi:hypothetical protein